MNSYRCSKFRIAAVAVVGIAWAVAVAPAHAANSSATKSSDVDSRARAECRDLLTDRGFKDIKESDLRSRDEGNRILVNLIGERRGDERDTTCVYDRDTRKAELAQGSGYAGSTKVADQARSECRSLMQNRGFNDIKEGDLRSRPEGNTILVSLIGDRKGDQRDLTCVYDPDTRKARIAEAGGRDGNASQVDQTARAECRDLLANRGFKNVRESDLRSRDDGNRVMVDVTGNRNGNQRDVTCVYDRDTHKAQITG